MQELSNVIQELQGHTTALGTFADADTTPSVLGASVWKTANTGGTSITTFDDGEQGRRIVLVFGDGNTTLVHGSNLNMVSNANFTGNAGDTRIFATDDGTKWYETPQG